MGRGYLLVNPVYKERFFFLLVALLVYLLVAPFLSGLASIRWILNMSLTAVLVSSVFALSDGPRERIFSAIFSLPMFLFFWAGSWTANPTVSLAAEVSGVFFFVYAVITTLRYVFRSEQVTLDVIAAAIVVYLFLGFIWAFAYQVVEFIWPGSFALPDGVVPNDGVFVYYSFVTLTTLGYGDITPVGNRAGTLAIVEAIIGQLYMTVLVARLVGIQISQSSTRKKND
jgi:hypothetical protein